MFKARLIIFPQTLLFFTHISFCTEPPPDPLELRQPSMKFSTDNCCLNRIDFLSALLMNLFGNLTWSRVSLPVFLPFCLQSGLPATVISLLKTIYDLTLSFKGNSNSVTVHTTLSDLSKSTEYHLLALSLCILLFILQGI